VGMLRRLLVVLGSWPAATEVQIVTPDTRLTPLARDWGARTVVQRGEGLNEGLQAARDVAVGEGATAILILPADLPAVTSQALERVRDAADAAIAAGSGRPVVVLVPADARRGTNGLLLSPPDVIEPCFGPSSLEQHLRAAAAADATVQVVVDSALAFDLDTPEDLARLDSATLHELEQLGAEELLLDDR
jgi:2-phospho-L-lactate guanylyltransferase